MAGGRKRAFDKQEALESAMKLFWQKGYAATSLSDLVEHMGINKPSMYSTFGNKEALFLQATQCYIEHYARPHLIKLTARDQPLASRLRDYLYSIVEGQWTPTNPKGCYVVQCAAEAVGETLPDSARALLAEAGQFVPQTLTQVFTQDPEALHLGLDKNASEHAFFLATLLGGTSVASRNKAPLEQLKSVIDTGLKAIGLKA